MTLHEAARHNKQQLAFMLSDEKTILAMCSKMVARRMEADGVTKEELMARERARMDELRRRHTGKASRRDIKAPPRKK